MNKKICRRCASEKDLSEFYKHKQTFDGRLNICKECIKKYSRERRWRKIDEVRAYDRKRGKLKHRIDRNIKSTKRLRAENPERYRAQTWVSNAIRDGRILKPQSCCECGSGGQIEGHHHDYSLPQVVDWLCSSCHKTLHHSETEYGERLRSKYKLPPSSNKTIDRTD